MNSYSLKLLVFFLLSSYALNAQNEFRKAYIVNLSNDTIRGFIDYNKDSSLSHKVLFSKSDSGADVDVYGPEDLMGFGFDNGRTFLRVPRNDNTGYVFAKRILKGKIDMLIWRKDSKVKPEVFLINNSTNITVQLSESEEKMIEKDGKRYMKRSGNFLNQISAIKGSEAGIQEQYNYKTNRILKDIKDYNKKYSSEYEIKEYDEETDRRFSLSFGYGTYYKSGHYRAAVYMNKIPVERKVQFTTIRGVSFRYFNEGKRGNLELNYDGKTNQEWYYTSLIPLGIQYKSISGPLKFYAYGGIGAALVIEKYNLVEDSVITGSDSDLRFGPTLNIGTGLSYEINDGELLFEVTPSIDSIFLNLGYLF